MIAALVAYLLLGICAGIIVVGALRDEDPDIGWATPIVCGLCAVVVWPFLAAATLFDV